MATTILLGVRFLPPDARLTRSWAIEVGSEEKPQTRAKTLKSLHAITFCKLSIVKSDAKGGQKRFSYRTVFVAPIDEQLMLHCIYRICN